MSSQSEAGTAGPHPRRRRSLRDTLMGSHLSLVALIVLGFGGATFVMMWRSIDREAEGDLLAAAQMMLREMQRPDAAGPPAIPETYLHRFGMARRDRAYFAIWGADGKLIASNGALPPHAVPAPAPPRPEGPHPFLSRHRGRHLDIILAAPGGGQLLIGRPLAKEFDSLWRLLAGLGTIAAACLIIGAAAAWWLSARIAGPIARMARDAGSISSQDLGRKLGTDRMPAELAELAAAFNSMLDGLGESFERQARFTADASHELRTPVAVILAQAEHALSRPREVPAYREALETCRQASRRMKRLIDDLLLLARADSGQLGLRLEAVDLAEVSAQAAGLLRPLAEGEGVRLELDLEPAIIAGDPNRLGQVVTNLAANALQYNVPGGVARISVRADGDAAILIVSDRGRGIAAADLPKLFDRFYRGDKARSAGGEGGAGLGLSLVAEIVKAHGGTIRAESEPGLGTTMTVNLPRPKAVPAPTADRSRHP